MKGLIRATNYYNKQEAMREYEEALNAAQRAGIPVTPIDTRRSGWRTIDKATAAITARLQNLSAEAEQPEDGREDV